MLLRAVADDLAPNFAALIERGSLIGDCVSAFPSVTPVACSEIATGAGPDRHGISGMNWYHRAEQRYVEYGSSLEATRAFGLFRTLYDTVYNMNMAHLSHEAETVFERLGDAGVRTAVTPFLIYRGRRRHELSLEGLLRRVAVAAKFRHAVWGPDELFYGELYASRRVPCKPTLARPGTRDTYSACVGRELVREDLYDFLLFSLPDNDHHTHTHGVDAMLDSISHADRSFGEIVDEAGGIDAFLDAHAVILMADHAQTDVETEVPLAAALAEEWPVLAANAERPGSAQLAVSPTAQGGGDLSAGGGRAPGRHPGRRARPPPAPRRRRPGGLAVVRQRRQARRRWSRARAASCAFGPARSYPTGAARAGTSRASSPRSRSSWTAAGSTTRSIRTAWRGCGRRSRRRTRGICWFPWSRDMSAWTGAGPRTSAAPATAPCWPATRSARWSSAASSPGSRRRGEQWALRDVAALVLGHFGVGGDEPSARAPGASGRDGDRGGGRPVSPVEETQLPGARGPRARRSAPATPPPAPPTGPGSSRFASTSAPGSPRHWVQLFKFGVVGGSGYVINLAVFAVLNEALTVHHILSAVGAFCVAVTNNFLWNRHWTFRATDGHPGFQAARFLTVSVLALGVNLTLLYLLVDVAGAPELPSQAISVAAAMPFNFIGNKLWTFGADGR